MPALDDVRCGGTSATGSSSAASRSREGSHAAAGHVRELLPQLVSSFDAAEGLSSFLERREARFTGR